MEKKRKIDSGMRTIIIFRRNQINWKKKLEVQGVQKWQMKIKMNKQKECSVSHLNISVSTEKCFFYKAIWVTLNYNFWLISWSPSFQCWLCGELSRLFLKKCKNCTHDVHMMKGSYKDLWPAISTFTLIPFSNLWWPLL